MSVFPKDYLTVVFRNYHYVPNDRLLKVLSMNEKELEETVNDLGIKNRPYFDLTKESYITIIRQNWDLLPNDQIIELLGFSNIKFERTLKEDDFLYVKLGEKPSTNFVKYEKLTEEDKTKLSELKTEIIKYKENKKYFDFKFTNYNLKRSGNNLIIYPFNVATGDAFLNKDMVSEDLLKAYSDCGVKSIWLHSVLSALSYYPFDPSVSEKFEIRRNNLQALINKANKYGIKVYLYFNEPRFLTKKQAENNKELIGHIEGDHYGLCLQNKVVQDYLYDATFDLVKNVHGIEGIFTITMSENLTHCFSMGETNCPHCKGHLPEEFAALVNNIIYKATQDTDKSVEVIANLWGWSKFKGWSMDNTLHGVDLLNKGISVLCVSEYDLDIEHCGVKSNLIDYSISNVGPSEVTKTVLSYAKEKGHKIYAKIQANNSWECSCVPYLPVYDLVFEHVTNLKNLGVKDLMLSWTVGGYPSKNVTLVNEVLSSDSFSLEKFYNDNFKFPQETHNAIKKICGAFKFFPFSIDNLYNSPKTLGPANLWRKDNTRKTTMVCFAFNDYQSWTDPFDVSKYLDAYKQLLDGWRDGLNDLKKLNDSNLDETIAFLEAAYYSFFEDYNQTKFAISLEKNEQEKIKQVIKVERQNTENFIKIFGQYPEIGYEPSNHYFYTTTNLVEKLLVLKFSF